MDGWRRRGVTDQAMRVRQAPRARRSSSAQRDQILCSFLPIVVIFCLVLVRLKTLPTRINHSSQCSFFMISFSETHIRLLFYYYDYIIIIIIMLLMLCAICALCIFVYCFLSTDKETSLPPKSTHLFLPPHCGDKPHCPPFPLPSLSRRHSLSCFLEYCVL